MSRITNNGLKSRIRMWNDLKRVETRQVSKIPLLAAAEINSISRYRNWGLYIKTSSGLDNVPI
jgi:hypothetical protein